MIAQLDSIPAGFIKYRIFLAALGPVVNDLQYWGSKEALMYGIEKRKLDPENQLHVYGVGEAKVKSHD